MTVPMLTRLFTFPHFVIVIACAAVCLTARADGVLEEIVVTAQKRSENLQDVPMSISALDGEALEAGRVEKIGDLALRIPNLSYSTFSSGRPALSVRGIGHTTLRSALEKSVILFVDEIYIARPTAYFFELFDLEQAAVLRGPQGVLFGKNVTGGAVSLTTRAPSLEDAEARLQVGYGSYNAAELKGVLSAPLTRNASGKLSLVRKTRDGYGMDLLSGAQSDDENLLALRAQWRVAGAGGRDILISADYSREDNGSQTRSVTRWDRYPPSASTGRPRRSEHGLPIGYDASQWGVSARLKQPLRRAELTALAAYRDVSSVTADQWGARSIAVGQRYDDLFGQDEFADQFSLEVRLAFEPAQSLRAIAGLYFIREAVDRLEYEEIVVNENGVLNGSRGDWLGISTTTGWAAFADTAWEPRPALTLRAGLRYTLDRKDNRTIGTLTDDAVPGIPLQIIFESYDVAAEASFDALTPRLVAEWRPFNQYEIMAYASWSKGFKSGGFDSKVSRASEAGRPIREEIANNFELGLKSRWLNDSLQVNASVFFTDFHDLQRVTLLFDEVSGVFDGLRVKNAARASIEGAELDLAWAPSASLLFNLAYGYLNARFDQFLVGTIQGFDIRRDGNRNPHSPRHSVSAAAGYRMELGDRGGLDFSIDYGWKHHFWFHSDNAPGRFERQASLQNAYGVANASLAWSSPAGRWRVTAWGKNLSDTLYADQRISFADASWAHYTPPRTYGVSLQFRAQ
ncbi:MAG: TonB-dependent receptor [Gammaproteobacteria bacterium]|nr:TonB-dependent receptor [Gammaproteobacteria bacterium]MXW44758.1 TonB-dependent receptor [Gammaproteobacteria bacterium]MYD01038.1 TonB-dependent receptor [Gammaproteobacteria bacterium]MYI23954.1 TonB-dependent receptor [Gammaproteobacteria bacterium]